MIDYKHSILPNPDGSTDNIADSPKSNKRKLSDYINSQNIVEFLDEEQLDHISAECIKGLEEDEKSIKNWLAYADKAMELTKLHREEKHSPWRNAANIKYPMISTAVIQSAARAEKEMIKNGKVAKTKVLGQDNGDPQKGIAPGAKLRRGNRIATHLNYQIQEKIPHWQNERDKLHHQLAVVGQAFTKTYFDPIEGMIRSILIPYTDIIVNNGITDLHEAPRISHYVEYSENRLVEKQRWEYFRDDIDICSLIKDRDDPDAIYYEFVEMHTWYIFEEIDEYYALPVIVTLHRASGIIFSIVMRCDESSVMYDKKGRIKKIYPTEYFTDYKFWPDPAGGFFGIGIGTLLVDSNSTCNTILNCLINAGTASTAQGGFLGKDLRIQKEDIEVDPTEWITVEGSQGVSLKDNIVPFSYKEPSQVLFQLFQYIVEAAKQLTSITDVMTGQSETQNVSPNTLMQLITQGMQVPNSVQRRIFRAFKRELQKIAKLNSKYVNEQEYIQLIGPSPQEMKEMYNQYGEFTDYNLQDLEVVPIVDVGESTQAEQLQRTQLELQIGAQILQLTPNAPAINPRMLARNAFTAIETPNVEQLVSPEPDPNAPNPQVIAMQHKMSMDQGHLDVERNKTQLKGVEMEALTKEREAKSVKLYSDAAVAHGGLQLDHLQAQMEHANNQTQAAIGLHKVNMDIAKTAVQHSAGTPGSEGQAAQPGPSIDSTLSDVHGAVGGLPQTQTDTSLSMPKGKSKKFDHSHLYSLAKSHNPIQVAKEAVRRGWKRHK